MEAMLVLQWKPQRSSALIKYTQSSHENFNSFGGKKRKF